MSVLQSDICEAFRDRGAAADKARKATAVLGTTDDDLTSAVASLKMDVAGSKRTKFRPGG